MISFISGIYNKTKLMDTENRLMVARVGGRKGVEGGQNN